MRKRSKDPSRRANWRTSSFSPDDPHTVDKEKIKDIEIVRTVVGGSTVYQA